MTFFPLEGPSGLLAGIATEVSSAALPLVLVHGIQGTSSSWRKVMQKLPPHIAAFAPNLRGREGSYTPTDVSAYSMSAFAGDLQAVLSQFDKPVRLAGWSMGVTVILEYLRLRGGNRVDSLALISGTPHPGENGAMWFMGSMKEDVAEEALSRAERLGLEEAADPMAVAGAWMACRGQDWSEVLHRIACPTVVLHGTEDDQCPLRHGELMAKNITGCRFRAFPGCGHNVLAEVPEAVAHELANLGSSAPFEGGRDA